MTKLGEWRGRIGVRLNRDREKMNDVEIQIAECIFVITGVKYERCYNQYIF